MQKRAAELRLRLHCRQCQLCRITGSVAVLRVLHETLVADLRFDALDSFEPRSFGRRRLGASIIRCGLFDRRHNVGILLSEFFFRHVCNLRFIFISGRDRCGIGFIENGDIPRNVAESVNIVSYARHHHHALICAHLHFRFVTATQQGVGEPFFYGLTARHPRFVRHHITERLHLDSRLRFVNLGDCAFVRIKRFNGFLQVAQRHIIEEQPRHAVYHYKAAGIDLHVVSGASNDRRCTRCDSLHDDRLMSGQTFQRVMNGDARIKVAAATVQLNGDFAFALNRGEVFGEPFGRYVLPFELFACPEIARLAFAHIAVHRNLRAILTVVCYDVPEPLNGRPRFGVVIRFRDFHTLPSSFLRQLIIRGSNSATSLFRSSSSSSSFGLL